MEIYYVYNESGDLIEAIRTDNFTYDIYGYDAVNLTIEK